MISGSESSGGCTAPCLTYVRRAVEVGILCFLNLSVFLDVVVCNIEGITQRESACVLLSFVAQLVPFTVLSKGSEDFLKVCLALFRVFIIFIDVFLAGYTLICSSKYHSTIWHLVYVHRMVQHAIHRHHLVIWMRCQTLCRPLERPTRPPDTFLRRLSLLQT